jgi:hypothetical protein
MLPVGLWDLALPRTSVVSAFCFRCTFRQSTSLRAERPSASFFSTVTRAPSVRRFQDSLKAKAFTPENLALVEVEFQIKLTLMVVSPEFSLEQGAQLQALAVARKDAGFTGFVDRITKRSANAHGLEE